VVLMNPPWRQRAERSTVYRASSYKCCSTHVYWTMVPVDARVSATEKVERNGRMRLSWFPIRRARSTVDGSCVLRLGMAAQ